MTKTLIGISLFSLLFTACQQNTPTNNQKAQSNAVAPTNVAAVNSNLTNVSPPASPTAALDKTKIKNYDGKGVVTKINLELGSVALDHEEIKDLMPAMLGMEFYVSDKKMLDNLKVGDKVDFVLEDKAGAEQIVRIKKS